MRIKETIKSDKNRKYVPANNYVESDVCLRGQNILIDVEIRRDANDIPCATFPIIRQIDEIFIIVKCKRNLIAVEGPRTELHDACLLIEGKICDIDRARALIDRWRHPEHFAVRIYQHVTFVTNLIVSISTINKVDIILI